MKDNNVANNQQVDALEESSDKAKLKSIALLYGIGLVLILSRIPWS